MGIKHFYYWFRNKYSENINYIYQDEQISKCDVQIDTLLMDLNGIFHNSAQKIYKYGDGAIPPRLLHGNKKYIVYPTLKKQTECFQDICETIERIVGMVEPRKKLILCIDGPAPVSKQYQQRQRRFRSASERSDDKSFDSCCITPGTKFMDYLSKYMDWFIRKKISSDEKWKQLEIIFSTEKCPGEGEHKALQYLRTHGDPRETFCIHGSDADLIMLALGTHFPNFYILRDDMHNKRKFHVIDIGKTRRELVLDMEWKGIKPEHKFDSKRAIHDFILMCFMVGNDFLPHMPCIEIIQGGIDTMIDVYRKVCASFGHLTSYEDEIRFVKRPFRVFLRTLSQYETMILEDKYRRRKDFLPDPLLDKCMRKVIVNDEVKNEVQLKMYRKEYYSENLPNVDKDKLCHEYLEGIQWVLTYYTKGVPNWDWKFPYHYAPFARTLSKRLESFRFPIYGVSKPSLPFMQLLAVLSPKSANLLPEQLKRILTGTDSPLKKYCPEKLTIDYNGKRKEWEGIVILPFLDRLLVKELYEKYSKTIPEKDMKRNKLRGSIIYKWSEFTGDFRSFYGNIKTNVTTRMIKL